jgi:hypothetical protein
LSRACGARSQSRQELLGSPVDEFSYPLALSGDDPFGSVARGGELSAYQHQHYVLDEDGRLDSHWTMPEMAERRITYLHSLGRTECKLVVRFTHDGMGLTLEEL